MNIMLCGASDTESIQPIFEKVVRQFGASPMSFLNVTHHHENSLTSTSEANSIASVADADICVFVIDRDYGHITWEVEFKHAIREGKPFIILCRKETRDRYYTYKADGSHPDNFDELYFTIHEIEEDRHLNLTPFSYDNFENELRREISGVAEAAIKRYTDYQRRKNAVYLLRSGEKLSSLDVKDLTDILIDEYENKKIRKDIIEKLAGLHELDSKTVLDLIASPEQGVSRLTLDRLALLMPVELYTQEFLDECVDATIKTEDSGAERRLVQTLLNIDLGKGLRAIADNLPIVEIGTKRRLAAELIKHKDEIEAQGLQEIAAEIGERCSKTADNSGWREDIKAFVKKMESQLLGSE